MPWPTGRMPSETSAAALRRVNARSASVSAPTRIGSASSSVVTSNPSPLHRVGDVDRRFGNVPM